MHKSLPARMKAGLHTPRWLPSTPLMDFGPTTMVPSCPHALDFGRKLCYCGVKFELI
jgi:hypothetical protein